MSPETPSSDWAIIAVAVVTGFFAWLATWMTNRRSVSASKPEPPASGPADQFALDTRDTVREIRGDMETLIKGQETIIRLLQDGRRIH